MIQNAKVTKVTRNRIFVFDICDLWVGRVSVICVSCRLSQIDVV